MRKLNRCISAVLTFMLLFTVFPSAAAALEKPKAESEWYIPSSEVRLNMPFCPADKYTSEQNPPTFKWPQVSLAEAYDLIVCSDSELKNVVYSKKDIPVNYYNFPVKFETGKDYYWAVRYKSKDINGGYSLYSNPRRFRIDPDAVNFVVPDTDTLLSKIPSGHPRIWTTSEKLADFRNLKNTNSDTAAVYSYFVDTAKAYTAENIIPTEEPVNSYRGSVAVTKTKLCAFAYLLSGDEEIGNFAKRMLMAILNWDIDGVTSYVNDDQVFRQIVYEGAMAYDWIYDLLTEDEKTAICAKIKERTLVMSYLIDDLKKMPYDSHGWTALGYVAIISLATYGDIDISSEWLEKCLPMYLAMMPPWSYEDGGWSQGTSYWAYSSQSNHEFISMLKSIDIIDGYDMAYLQNEYLWTLYVYPPGVYDTFGDANIGRPEDDVTGQYPLSLGEEMVFTRNPVLKWQWNQLGLKLLETDLRSYIINGKNDIVPQVPANYPLGHHFRDIGWVVMTDSLLSKNRIQMTFKSSPYGSYNHSHADQNSFNIQAFGEELAVQGGYYDYYHSPHHKNYTRQTFAHNTITMNGGKFLQLDGRTQNGVYISGGGFLASGQIEQFANGFKFDSLTGNAVEAYKEPLYGEDASYFDFWKFNNVLDKCSRSMIYIRPNVFVVIDDLDAKDGRTYSYDWWLNAGGDIEYTDNSALITKGKARLNAKVQYPANTTATYYDTFYNTEDEVVYDNLSKFQNEPVQKRVAFSTPECNNTKMVVTMDVYRKEDGESNIVTTNGDGYLKMEFEDGSVVYVNLKADNGKVVTADGIEFTGAAVTVNSESIMLTDGTLLRQNGKDLISSNKNITLTIGYDQLSISANDDVNVKLLSDSAYMTSSGVKNLKNLNGRTPSAAIGIVLADNGEYTDISLQKGNYKLRAGNLESMQQLLPDNIKVEENKDTEKAQIYWDARPDCTYDIKIDGVTFKNCTVPYEFSAKTGNTYKVSLRAVYNGVAGAWTDDISYSSAGNITASYVEYSAPSDSTVGAKAYVSNSSGKNIMMLMNSFDRLGMLLDTKAVSGSDEILENYIALTSDTDSIKTFLWEPERLEPVKSGAVYNSDNTDIRGIYLDGVLIDGFDNAKNTYTVDLSDSDAVPVITAMAADNASEIHIRDYSKENYVDIEVVSPKGTSRTVKMCFENTDNAKPYITNLKMASPTPPDGWDKLYTVTGMTENAAEYRHKKSVDFNKHGNYAVKTYSDFADGARAYMDRTAPYMTIKNINKFIDIEGCQYIPPCLDLIYNKSLTCWYIPYYFGLGTFTNTGSDGNNYTLTAPSLNKTPQDWISFELNRSAKIYVASSGDVPGFIDSTWKKLPVTKAFDIYQNEATLCVSYDKIYEKEIYVPKGGSKNVTIQTPGTGNYGERGLNFILIKLID